MKKMGLFAYCFKLSSYIPSTLNVDKRASFLNLPRVSNWLGPALHQMQGFSLTRREPRLEFINNDYLIPG